MGEVERRRAENTGIPERKPARMVMLRAGLGSPGEVGSEA